MWKPSKNEMLEWTNVWEYEFPVEEMKNFQMSLEEWKEKYLYSNFCEVYFVEFPILLSEWLERKTTIRTIRILKNPIIWAKYRVNWLKNVKNHRSRAMYGVYTSIMEGYIV